MQASQLGNASTIGDGLLQATALRLADIAQKPKYIQEVRLARGVRAKQVGIISERHIDIAEIPPVLQRNPLYEHDLVPTGISPPLEQLSI